MSMHSNFETKWPKEVNNDNNFGSRGFRLCVVLHCEDRNTQLTEALLPL